MLQKASYDADMLIKLLQGELFEHLRDLILGYSVP
jgi:hypothetical protein